MNKKIKDVSGKPIEIGDSVFVLDSINQLINYHNAINLLEVGNIIDIDDNDKIIVKIGKTIKSFDNTRVGKINPNESIDDIIIELANNLETLNLIQESDILNSMLQG
jgi:hypothetical protein